MRRLGGGAKGQIGPVMSCHSGRLTPVDSVGHAGGGGAIGIGLGRSRRDAQVIPPSMARTAMPTRAATVPANTGPLKVPGSAPARNFPGGALVVAAGCGARLAARCRCRCPCLLAVQERRQRVVHRVGCVGRYCRANRPADCQRAVAIGRVVRRCTVLERGEDAGDDLPTGQRRVLRPDESQRRRRDRRRLTGAVSEVCGSGNSPE